MAWSNPSSRSTGDLVTAAIWNQDAVDNPQFLYNNLRLPYVHLLDEQANNTEGGSFASGAWRTRVLNTKVTDTDNICTLNTNQFTLPAGTYRVLATAPASRVARHKLRVQNITDGTTALLGGNENATSASDGDNHAHVQGRFTIAAQKTFELQHYCSTTRNTDGFGRAANFGVVEVYAQVEIWKEDTA